MDAGGRQWVDEMNRGRQAQPSSRWVEGWYFFFFQAEDGIRDYKVTGVQTCALPISAARRCEPARGCPCGAGGGRKPHQRRARRARILQPVYRARARGTAALRLVLSDRDRKGGV